MSQTEPDPSQSTAMFRAFVDRGPADTEAAPRRGVPPAVIVAIVVAIVVVLAVVAWLVL